MQPQRDAVRKNDLGRPGRSEQRPERQGVEPGRTRPESAVPFAPATERGITKVVLTTEGDGGEPAAVEVSEELLDLEGREPSPCRRPDARRTEFGVHPATVPVSPPAG